MHHAFVGIIFHQFPSPELLDAWESGRASDEGLPPRERIICINPLRRTAIRLSGILETLTNESCLSAESYYQTWGGEIVFEAYTSALEEAALAIFRGQKSESSGVRTARVVTLWTVGESELRYLGVVDTNFKLLENCLKEVD